MPINAPALKFAPTSFAAFHDWHALPSLDGSWCRIPGGMGPMDNSIFHMVGNINPTTPPATSLQILLDKLPPDLPQQIMDAIYTPTPIMGHFTDIATGKQATIGQMHKDGSRSFDNVVPGTELSVTDAMHFLGFQRTIKFNGHAIGIYLIADANALTNRNFGAALSGISVEKSVNILRYPGAKIKITGGRAQDGHNAFFFSLILTPKD